MNPVYTVILSTLLLLPSIAAAQPDTILLKPARVFDGVSAEPHAGWVVLIRGEKIAAAGLAEKVEAPKGARNIELPGTTLLPGLIDAHSHLLLYPYDQAKWDDQVLKESHAERICRATVHVKANLLSGFTTLAFLTSLSAGMIMMGLGVIGLYISRIYTQTQNRPVYLIRSVYRSEEGES